MELYSDETTTGRLTQGRSAKATVAARLPDDLDDFDWWRRWVRDFFPAKSEPKSAFVWQIAASNEAASKQLIDGISACSIFVIDFAENSQRLLSSLAPFLPKGWDASAFLASRRTQRAYVDRVLNSIREISVMSSVLGEVESLVRAEPLVKSVMKGMGVPSRDPGNHVFDPDGLRELNDKEFLLLVARVAVALGDALHPDRQAAAFEEEAIRSRYFSTTRVACRLLGSAIQEDYIFDISASANVTESLRSAHSRVADFIEAQQRDGLTKARVGALKERDSVEVMGIQVADIAAAHAAMMVERGGGPTRDSLPRLKNAFAGVFFNDRWI